MILVQDAGSEIFERILVANGYEKYDHNKQNINELIDKKSKKKRFTFITGEHSKDEKRINKDLIITVKIFMASIFKL